MRLIGNIATISTCLASRGMNLAGHRLRGVVVEIEDADFRAAGSELLRDGPSDAAATTRDGRDFAVQTK